MLHNQRYERKLCMYIYHRNLREIFIQFIMMEDVWNLVRELYNAFTSREALH